MIKLEKKFIFALFLAISILIFGCTGKKDVKKSLEEIRTGSDGIVINFLPNAPPEMIHVEENQPNQFDIVLELKNKGAYPQPGEGASGLAPSFGKIFLSGFDPKIITFESKDKNPGDLSTARLEGKSTINPNGGQDIMSFTGKIDFNNLNVEKYEPTLLATACYYYSTTAGPSVCIDPDPYSTINTKKVCQVQDTTLTNQGAPIAVTGIGEEAFATKTQFRITIKNVGAGDVLKADAANNKCDPYGTQKIDREDINQVELIYAKISDIFLICGPFASSPIKNTGGLIRLINGEGSITCELQNKDYSKTLSSYTTPLLIQLAYGYKVIAQRKLQVKKEGGGLGSGGSSSGSVPDISGVTRPSSEPSHVRPNEGAAP